MDKIQIGPWCILRAQQLLCLWVATVTEMSTGHIPNASQMGRYLKRLPPLKECLVHCDSIKACMLSAPFVSLWGERIDDPLILNVYRSFLSRISMPVDDKGSIGAFFERAAAALDEKEDTLIRAILPYCPSLLPPARDWSNYCEFGPGAIAQIPGQLSLYRKIQLLADQESDSNDMQDSTSRIILVPKNWKKKRLIAAEPIRLGYLQHGLATMLMRSIEACSPIRFSDQGQNRQRCDISHATLDLSDASDSVLLRHVELIMPEWYEQLLSVRSTYGRYQDTVVPLGMYGTMGSACTFPVETWVFYSLSYGIMNYLGATGEQLRDLRVYGDDIVTPVIWGQVVADFLSSVGFKVNESKSFWDSSVGYRETCGVETMNNIDITPLRLPRGSTEMWLERVDFQSFSDFLSQLPYYGCFELQRVLLSSIGNWDPFRPTRMEGARLGCRLTHDALPPFTVFAPLEDELSTNLTTEAWKKHKCVFNRDQWDTFARDYILHRQRQRWFSSIMRRQIDPGYVDFDVSLALPSLSNQLWSSKSEKIRVRNN
ncbi:TPA_asm: RNA-directed RNA polymerase [ssRNA phage SRR6960799_5]|uniref:RNA-directed RNA polymerase n=1 Tax=ssRNA phage SRR6960799_5 TaxID=2786601 RepID=A0A8S5KZQ5_9VIRU|nr:RNA-directed RNA polymerase [ssRNA phage SRR6960799_5]DAD50663.1 TPA_asm: RNA-directed RNA polymerase [ssRNA phage SRR6960799_5]